MRTLLNTLYNKVKENPEEYFWERASTWSIQTAEINWFKINVYFWYWSLLDVSKGWTLIYKEEDTPINYIIWYWGKFKRLIEWIEKRTKKCEKMQKELKESIEEQKKQDFIKGWMDNWIKELEWIEVSKWTKEFDEVIRDTKRLQEISKEAQTIHKRYQKSFFNS